ncbi:50S ribosomal protein L20 [Candidatus Roizmanbacteria bacterium RIFCSPHIGHO2_01_FULL_39_12c]|uniref:Large ribosomal subunit protein bL20 n=1 Tax=Candidatus Roizmanbacteria bacterium RIFCSPHIGHO2_01_FULL_39_12c TaxID=1802031 RepID=A0A1F7G7Y9_9BACT|nr:MAG: 50S ribosomal protein L20 [Candidatus Roizmanbacteria bacterium RIFCSPHIGHO2_01_FULL_39_12c]OGK46271.1 MAG: 50S ribosomal protein L20 [Candidatus Roizmanbacteria bacterium RIFCSPLOWO2_01_FULL_40_13]
MVRVKSGVNTRRRHKKVLKLAKGYWMTRHKQFKKAKEAVLHSGEYAFAGRKDKKRDFRRLWITRISAATRSLGMIYSTFTQKIASKKISLDRKILAQIAVEYPKVFEKIVEKVKV